MEETMRYTIRYTILFLLVFILTIEGYADIVKDVINKDNSILSTNIVGGILRCKNGQIWISSPQQLISTNTDRSKWVDHTDIIRKNLLIDTGLGLRPMTRIFYMNEDKYSNLFFYNWAGIAISYSNSEEWSFFTQDNPDLPSYTQAVCLNDVEYTESTERIYTSGMHDTLYFAQYNSATNKYEMQDSYRNILNDNIKYIHKLISLDDSLVLVLGLNRYVLLNTNTGEKDSICLGDYHNFFDSFDWENGPMKPIKVPNQNRILIPTQRNDIDTGKKVVKSEIYDITFEDNTITKWVVIEMPKTLEASTHFFTAGWVDEEKKKLFLGNYSDMWIYNIDNQVVSIIPTPDEYGEDKDHRWVASSGCILYPENEIWLANGNYAITICNLDELVSTAISSVNVIDIDEFIPILGIDKVYPLPSASEIYIDYFQQIGTTEEVSLKVYNVRGEEVPNIEFKIQTVEGMRKKLTITSGLKDTGTYFAEIKLKGNKAYTKFIYQ